MFLAPERAGRFRRLDLIPPTLGVNAWNGETAMPEACKVIEMKTEALEGELKGARCELTERSIEHRTNWKR